MSDKIAKKLAEVLSRAKKLGSKSVVVGIPSGNDGEHDHITNSELGMIHEFGSPTQGIPERSFMRSTLSEESGNLGRLSSKQIASYLRGETSLEDAYATIGIYLEGAIVEKITDGDFVANKPETAKRKGSDKPLIDTGSLRASITYEVRDNDS